ncbi:MAG: SGNH/GDSL hydrolase family protein [Planctomycetota bacterium]|jgi:phospholipase/lecithinase/hemolysin
MKRVLILLSLLVAAMFASKGADAAGQQSFDEIIIFGASMSDNGNAYILTNGQYGGPPNFTGRFSNGPVWVERLAENLGLGTPTEQSPLPAPSEAGGTNYAVAGASTGYVVSTQGAPGMGLQIDAFFDDGRTLDGNELIVVQGGGNESSAIVAAKNVISHVDRLAKAGGKHILVNNHFRGSQAPGVTRDGWVDQYLIKYGKLLAAGLDLIEAKYDVTIYRFDMLGLTDDMIANPGDYGLTNITEPLRPTTNEDPDKYMWWDNLHFTAKVHQIFADAAADLVCD